MFKTIKESCQLTNSPPAIFVMQNDMEPSKAVPLNAAKQDGPAPKPHSVSLSDTETRKLVEECKRLQGEMMKLSEENRLLRVSCPPGPTLQRPRRPSRPWPGRWGLAWPGRFLTRWCSLRARAWHCRLQQQCSPCEGPPLSRAGHQGVLSQN